MFRTSNLTTFQRPNEKERKEELIKRIQTLKIRRNVAEKTAICFKLCVNKPERPRFDPRDKTCFENCINNLTDSTLLVINTLSQTGEEEQL